MKKKIKLNISKLAFVIWIILIIVFFQLLTCVPINLHSLAFVLDLFILVFSFNLYFASRKISADSGKVKPVLVHTFLIVAVFFLACLIVGPYTGGLNHYKNQSVIKEISFDEIPEFDATQVQLIDKDTARQIGDRVFGTLGSQEVSQYQVGDEWTQISYNGRLYRVTPIDFGGFFKYLATGSTPGYIIVDCNSGEAKLVTTEGLQYIKSAYFFKDIGHHLYFHDPFSIKAQTRFELDDAGKPYWVTPVMSTTFISKTSDVKGVYICDPQDGKISYYAKEEIPGWVDNVYPIGTVYRQFRQSKRYENGLFNFSNKGVVEFTDDYAYVQFDDHVHIYTGVTSVGKDESNVGFAYVDLRNGEIRYINRAGAEEYSARSSAEGALQQYHYTAIFPSMVNVSGVPTYFMGMVDGANLIKSYAFVSYENYQNVGTGMTVEDAYNNYQKLIGGKDRKEDPEELQESSFTAKEMQIIVIDGNSIVLLKDEKQQIYTYDLSRGDYRASFLKENDAVKVKADAKGEIWEFLEIVPSVSENGTVQ